MIVSHVRLQLIGFIKTFLTFGTSIRLVLLTNVAGSLILFLLFVAPSEADSQLPGVATQVSLQRCRSARSGPGSLPLHLPLSSCFAGRLPPPRLSFRGGAPTVFSNPVRISVFLSAASGPRCTVYALMP